MYAIAGKIKAIGPVEQGTTKAGKPWSRQTIVIEAEDRNYVTTLAVEATNSTATLPDYAEGDPVEVGFNVASREYNGRWYTDVRMVYMDHLDPQGRKTPDNIPYRKIAEAKAKNTPAPAPAEAAGDDLPF